MYCDRKDDITMNALDLLKERGFVKQITFEDELYKAFDEGMVSFVGIVLGLIGIAVCIVNYPLYRKILKKGRDKYSYEILKLAKEITGEE